MSNRDKQVSRHAAWLLSGVALVAAMAPGVALAQDAATATTAQPAADQGGSEIIVTANRRQERGQDVPIALTALSPQRLEQQGITKEQDLQASVPSLVVGTNGQGSRDSNSFTIRGQGATFQASPGVVVYLNEVPLPSGITLSQQGGPGNFVDLENMQVLSGPQGTLFGRNTTGGAVLLVPKKPGDELGGWIKGEYGNYNRAYVEGAVNLPVNDKLAIRVAGAFHDRGGYTHDVVWNKDRDNEHWYSGRVGILWKPTDTIKNYTMIYGSYSNNNGAGLIHKGFNIDGLKAVGSFSGGVFTPTPFCLDVPATTANDPTHVSVPCSVYRAVTARADALGPRQTAFSTDTFSRTQTWGLTNTTDIDLSDTLTVRNIASYQKMKVGYRYDGDATVLQQHDVDPGALPGPGVVTSPFPINYFNSTAATELPRDNLRVWTEELQLQAKLLDNKLNLTVGGFYFDQRPSGLQGSRAVLYCPALYTGFCTASQAQYSTSSVSKALYAQATLDFGAFSPSLDGLRLTAGYRQTWDHVFGFATQYNFTDPTLGQVRCGKDNASVPLATALSACRFDGDLHSTSPSWLVGLDYKVARGVMLYAKASHSYKAGGFNPYAVFFGQNGDPDTRTFRPESVTSYEAGFKSDFRLGDVPVRLNVAAYHTDYKDIQRATGDYNPTTTAGGARTLNGDARIEGVEVEASVRPLPGVELGGNFSYTNAKYTNYVVNGVNLNSLPFQYVAPYIWSIHASVEHSLGDNLGTLAAFVNYSHSSSQYTEAVQFPQNQPGAYLESFGLLNASLDLRNVGGSKFDLGVFGTNLTNSLYRISNTDVYQQGGLLYWSTLYGEPRMYGVRLKYKFGGG